MPLFKLLLENFPGHTTLTLTVMSPSLRGSAVLETILALSQLLVAGEEPRMGVPHRVCVKRPICAIICLLLTAFCLLLTAGRCKRELLLIR
jgi:hypothetical protein